MQHSLSVMRPSSGPAAGYSTTFTPASGVPFRVSFTGGGIEVTGLLKTQERADELIRAINALKILLMPVTEAKPPEGGDFQT